jgi:hypothetical protein
VRRLLAAILLAGASGAIGGCASEPPVPAVLAFPRAEYDRAFEAALEGARADGLQPVVVDRELGVIETAPRSAGSFLEPWRGDNAGLEDTMAHTVNFERRRARIEFVPQSFAPPTPALDAPAQGPAIPGSDRAEGRFDLTQFTGTVEMRAWVYLDRGFRPNQRIGAWTLSQETYSADPTQQQDRADESTRTPTEWTPIGRDVPYEQRLMRRIAELMARPSGSATAGTDAPPAADPPH